MTIFFSLHIIQNINFYILYLYLSAFGSIEKEKLQNCLIRSIINANCQAITVYLQNSRIKILILLAKLPVIAIVRLGNIPDISKRLNVTSLALHS